jgi:hypothetical protein
LQLVHQRLPFPIHRGLDLDAKRRTVVLDPPGHARLCIADLSGLKPFFLGETKTPSDQDPFGSRACEPFTHPSRACPPNGPLSQRHR